MKGDRKDLTGIFSFVAKKKKRKFNTHHPHTEETEKKNHKNGHCL